MDVLMPDGTLVTGVPEGITQSDLLARYGKFSASKAEATSPEASSITKNAEGQITGMGRDAYLAAVEKRKQEIPERTLSGTALDAGITFLKGAIGLPEAAVGVASLPTMGYAGKLLQNAGFNTKEAKEILDSYYSEAQQAANRRVGETKGFLPTIGAALENPSVIAQSAAESLPQMLGGASVAKGLMSAAPAIAPYLAGALGEGVLGAGSAAEQMRQESKDQLLSGKQVASAIGSGLGTAAFSVAAGKLANKLGLEDIDTLLAGGATKGGSKSVMDFAKRAAASGVSEGLFEEFPQSVQEQMWMNYAQGKPLMEGTAEAGAMGAITGAAMGVGANVLAGKKKTPPGSPEAEASPPPPGVPPVAPNKVPLAAAPSESMDTEAMLREALGEKPTVTPVTVEEPKAQIQPTVAESGPFVRKQMEEQTPTTPTPVSIEGTPSATEASKAVEAEAQGQQAPATPVTTEAPTEQTKLPGRAVTEVPLNKLTLSEDVPQFKADANKAGVVEPLGGKFERTGVAPIQVWRRTDGRLEVISGRHRFDLAKRSGEETIPAQIHDEASGFNRDMAAVLDAELNIRDGQGKVKDYVNYFKGTGLDQKTADSRGLLARAPGKRAFTIANQGSDELVAGVRADQIGDEAAYLIALNAPNDARLQGVSIKAIQDGKSATSAINLMQAVKALAGESDTTTDMFGFDDSAMKEAEAMAKIAAAKQREMQTRLAAISGAAKNPAVAKSEGIDIKDPVAVKRRIEELRRMKVAWDSWSTSPDLVAEIRAERGTPAPELKTRSVEEEIPPAIETEIDQLFGSVEDAEQMVEDNLTPQEQDNELEKARNEQTKGEGNAERTEPEGEDLFAEPSEEETLTKPTLEGLRAKEEYRNKAEAAEAAEAKANKEAEDKAKADKEVGEFTLTGSERAADVAAARGQKDLLAEEEEKAEEAPEEEGVKVVPFEADSSTVGDLLSETRDEENPFDIRYNALMHAADKPAKPKPQEMLTPEEAKAKLEEWKAEAKRQGKTSKNFGRTIMSLFDASGEWSQPWVDAGYNVWTFDIQNGEDINDFSAEFLLNEGFGDMEIWGILAAPPCTDFASSGAQFWAKKDAKGQTELSNELVKQVLRTVEFLQPKIWAMENPVGRIAKLNNLPPAHLTFDPNYYGDPYTKKTLLWGNFDNNLPMAPVEPTEGSKIHKISGKNKYARSLTPEGFAYAFFMANNAESMTPAERLTRTYYGVDPKAFEGATEADEEAIDSSEFQDFYYDGDLGEAADIARDIIGKKQEAEEEKAPAKPEPVETPEGRNLRYPMAAVLFNDGYEVLALDNPRTYVDKGGEPHRTFEKDGVRISLTPQLVLFQNKNTVLTGQGESTDLVINALLVDQAKRNQGKANEALQNIVDAADQYGVTLYIEPVPLVNVKEKNIGLDSQQLEDLYKKFGFDFAEDSNKVMVRDPEVEVLGPAEKPAAPQLKNEPYTIEGDFTEIGEEKQHLLLTDQTSKLSEAQTKTLEDQYGAKRGTDKFIESVRKDVVNFITQGAKAVNGKIRAIIRQIANGVLTVAIVFNPQFVSKPYTIAVPQYDITTSEVIKDLPKEAQSMSDAAKRAYGVIYPALEKQLKEKDKLFIVADKRSGNTYLFNPDGSLLLQSKTLFGKAIGDYMHGDNEIEANRITPAGVFDLGLRDAKRSAGEAYTAGDYDFGKVFVLDKSHMGSNGPYSNTIMHSVWTHETDAKQRLAALEKPGAEDSRYSFGCINVNKETFKYLITNHLNQMDGAKIFIVPENGANVMDFINGKAMNSDDIIRQKVEPVTKTTVTEKKVPAPKQEVERKVAGREEEVAKLEVKEEKETPKKPKEPKEQTFYDIQGYADEERGKRSTSLKRTIKTLNRMRKDGRITDEKFVEKADAAIAADEEQRLNEEPNERKRGFLHIQTRLNQAVDAKDISREARDLATWFMANNEDLVSDLGISIIGKVKPGQGGQYNAFNRIMTVIKNGGSDLTTVHEILHHLERMMPTKIQQAIRKAWSSQLAKAAKAAKTPNEKLYFAALMDAHYGDGNIANIEIPKGAEKTYEQIKSLLKAMEQALSSENFAMEMLKLGMVPTASYEYFNPSEFWAVNGSDIVKARFDAVRGGVLARLKNWLKELGQKIKSLFGLKSDASIIRALDSLAKSDGKFVTRDMLGEGNYLSIERSNYKGDAAPEPVFEAPIPTALDTFAYTFLDKQHDMRSVINEIQKVRGELVNEQIDPYLKNESYLSRKAAQEQAFIDNSIEPIVKAMYDNKVSVLELEAYMHNRHAEERNIQIAEINPSLPDGGSGIMTNDALKYLTELPEDKLKIYNKIAKMFDKIVDGTQDILVDSGAEVQDTINSWNAAYEHYVPLQREDLDFVHHGVGNGGGLGSRGAFSRRAFGSTKNVANILQNIVLQRVRAIDRAEKIRVGKALMGLVLTNPNPNFWLPINPNAVKSIKKFKQEVQSLGISADEAENMLQEPKSPSIDKETGLVKYAVNPAMRSMDNVFPVRINGQDWFIIFNPSDERALRMVKSLRNLDVEKLGIMLGTIGMVTRWISSINTQYNPIFGAWNFGRDFGSAMLQLTTTELAGQQDKVRKSILPSLAAIFKEQRGWSNSEGNEVFEKGELTQQEWRDLYNRWKLAGGSTGISLNFTQQKTRIEKLEKGWGINGLLSIRATSEEISLLDKKLAEMDAGKMKQGFNYVATLLSDYNDAMEGAMRLATFKVAVIDNGMSDDKAASLSKNVTINFDTKGAMVPKLQALYSFINPGIRGAVMVKKVLTGPKGKAIIASGIGLGVLQAILLMGAGFDDDDPPEFVKEKAFVIPKFWGAKDKYVVVFPPYPPGFSMLPGIGRMLTEAFMIKAKMMKSNKSASDKLFDILPMMLDSVNPLGIGATWQQLVPTAADPFANVWMNQDAFGRPIARKDRPGEETPGYERSRESATTISKGVAYFLNWASSPSDSLHTKGKISPTADQLDYLAEQLFGGVFREMVKGGEAVGNKIKEEEQPMYRIPVAGKIFGETKTPAAISSRFYDNLERMNTFEHEIKQRETNKEPTDKYMKAHPTASLWKEANAAQREVSKINKEKRLAIERKASKEEIKRIDERKTAKMKEFNDKVRAAQ